MYNTTKRAVVEVGENDAQDLKVHKETAPEIKKAPREDRRRSYKVRFLSKKKENGWRRVTHRERGVPSSANWNPTNPFTRRHQHVAVVRPHCTATKYGNTTDASGTTPESRMSEVTVRAIYK